MYISQYNRVKISAISFVCIILVVLIHSNFKESIYYPTAHSIQLITGSTGLAIVAVPMFYAISGLLFFNGINRTIDCFPKIKKRCTTLFIPYLCWNVIFVLWYVVLELNPALSGFTNSRIISNIDWHKPFETIEYLFIEPVGFHLWFLRDLIVFTILSPILYVIVRYIPWIGLVSVYFVTILFPGLGLTYFMLGGIISLHYDLEKVSKALSPVVSTIAFLIYISSALLQPAVHIAFPLYTQLVSICAIIVLWHYYDVICKNVNIEIRTYDIFAYTFFIYLFHEPAFNVIKKLSLKFFGTTTISLLISYFINVVVMVLLAYILGKALKRTLPGLYSILTGGR